MHLSGTSTKLCELHIIWYCKRVSCVFARIVCTDEIRAIGRNSRDRTEIFYFCTKTVVVMEEKVSHSRKLLGTWRIVAFRCGVSSDFDLEEFTTGIPRNLRNPKDPTSLSKRSVIDFRILSRLLLEHLEIYSPKDTLSLPPRAWVLPEPRHHRRRNI